MGIATALADTSIRSRGLSARMDDERVKEIVERSDRIVEEGDPRAAPDEGADDD